MASDTENKIRRVAIVLQSLDAATAKRLLAQLPDSQAKQVRRTMASLGTVSPTERKHALADMQDLVASVSNNNFEPSTASQVLAKDPFNATDSIELSDTSNNESGLNRRPSTSSSPDFIQRDLHTPQVGPWIQLSASSLAGILSNERPIVVAAIINQLPIPLATNVLQLLPIEIASDVMTCIPSLHRAEPTILEDLLNEMRTKLTEAYESVKAAQSGIEKLRAIVSQIPVEHRGIWSSAIGRRDPTLVSALGFDPTPIGSSANEPSHSANSNRRLNDPSSASPSTKHNGSQSPFSVVRNDPDDDVSSSNSSNSTANFTVNSGVSRSLDELLTLTDKEFVLVLEFNDSKSVLLALSEASRSVILRIERMIPKQDVSRFRQRIASLRDVSLRDIDRARTEILQKADMLRAAGKIAKLTPVTFVAAA